MKNLMKTSLMILLLKDTSLMVKPLKTNRAPKETKMLLNYLQIRLPLNLQDKSVLRLLRATRSLAQ